MNVSTEHEKFMDIGPYEAASSDEDYMCQRQLDYFQRLLQAWREYLCTGASKTVCDMQKKEDQHADIVDQAAEEEKFRFELRTRDRERKLLKKIDLSLETIRSNAKLYGYCKDCDLEIGIKRLQARPTAELCVDCKGLMDIKERH